MLTPAFADALEQSLHPMLDQLRELEGKSVLITGANGLIPGTLLASLAVARKHLGIGMDLCATCHVGRAFIDSVIKAGFGPIDVLTANLATTLPPEVHVKRHDYIVHGASLASPRKYLAQRINTMKVNVFATLALLEKARSDKARNFLYISSGEIYGNPDPADVPTPETLLPLVNHLADRGCYTESKRFAETLCLQFSRETGQVACAVRPIHVFGPGLRPDDGRVVADFLANVLEARPIVVRSDGSDRRAFCYSLDANLMLLKVLLGHDSGFEAYNIGNPENDVSIAELAHRIARLGASQVQILGEKPVSALETPGRSSPDIAKITGRFGKIPLTPLDAGLQQTLEWMRESGTVY